MGIQNDAGEILNFFYKEYLDNRNVDAHKLLTETGWEGNRLDRTIKYLKDLNLVKLQLYMGNQSGLQNFSFIGLTPEGIQTVENKTKFKNTFGILINAGIFKFSW